MKPVLQRGHFFMFPHKHERMEPLQLISNTPLLRLSRLERALSLKAALFGKLEAGNLTGSVKDRAALAMAEAAEREGKLTKDTVIVEPSSGNMGISLAAVCAVKGYSLVVVMPDSMSEERRRLIQAYGAKVHFTPGAEGMRGAIACAERLAEELRGVILGQFESPANPRAHYETTGPEIWQATGGKADVLVAGVGSGGTISGAGRYLKEQNPDLLVVAVEPASSPVLTKGVSGPHKIQGIGAGFIPKTLDRTVYDMVIAVEDEEAFRAARMLARTEGVLCGISSGAALSAACALCGSDGYEGKTVVAVLPDGGGRYLTTDLFGE